MKIFKDHSLKWKIYNKRCPKCKNIFLALKVTRGRDIPDYGMDGTSWGGMQCDSCRKIGIYCSEYDPIYNKIIHMMEKISPPRNNEDGYQYCWGISTWTPEKDHIFELSVDDCPCGGKFRILSSEYCSSCKSPKLEIDWNKCQAEVIRVTSGRVWGRPSIITHFKILEGKPSHNILKQILTEEVKKDIKNYGETYIRNGCPKKWFPTVKKRNLDEHSSPSIEKSTQSSKTPQQEKDKLSIDTSKSLKIETITNTIGIKMNLIQAGEFTMGDMEWYGSQPLHKVKITKPFYLGIYPVTQSEWNKVVDKNSSLFKGENFPVENIKWDDCLKFVEHLNERENQDGYRLPTEAEWEYACRAGSPRRYCFGDDESDLGNYAWYKDNSDGQTHSVGKKKPNAWGLYDMHGNVFEWCWDRFNIDYYKECSEQGTVVDPKGPTTGNMRVRRGGSFYHFADHSLAGFRSWGGTNFGASFHGFRIAKSF
jgi:formylglycine-generating enzyme required for sulfatase activity